MDRRENLFNELQREQTQQSAPAGEQQTQGYQSPPPGYGQNPPRNDYNGQQYNQTQQQQNTNPQQHYNNPQQYNQNPQNNPYYRQYNPNQQRYPANYPNNYDYVPVMTPDQKAAAEAKEAKNRSRREKTIVVLFFMLVIIAAVMGVFGIVYDIVTSEKRIKNLNTSDKIVIYQSEKPEGADKIAEELDEYGRYSTEGAAAAVRESIVEIYTYDDAFQNRLEGTGSGVVLNEEGYIVTNAHVLKADGYHDVHTADGKIHSASIVGRDSKTDIAVLKINASGLVPAILGNSDEVVVGEEVIAIGNPAGLTGTVTNGIVSAVNREIRSDSTGFEMNCIQTNAAISPGNSGGALVNMFGQVIGITSSKYVSGFYEGLGFAITINEAKPIIEELISNGFIGGRFRIGITLIDMSSEANTASIEDELGFELPKEFKGIYISDISQDCDIANTALEKGDFITKIDGTHVETYDELYDTISASYGAGDTVPATCAKVDKDGNIEEYEIEFKLMEDTSGDY